MKRNPFEKRKAQEPRIKEDMTTARSRLGSTLVIGVLASCAVLTLSVRPYNHRSGVSAIVSGPSTESRLIEGSTSTSVRPQVSDQAVEVELITVHPYGLEPREISRPSGPFILAVHNRSRLDQVSLQLNRANGFSAGVREISLPAGKLRQLSLLDLPPGQYVLTDTVRPNFECKITITP